MSCKWLVVSWQSAVAWWHGSVNSVLRETVGWQIAVTWWHGSVKNVLRETVGWQIAVTWWQGSVKNVLRETVGWQIAVTWWHGSLNSVLQVTDSLLTNSQCNYSQFFPTNMALLSTCFLLVPSNAMFLPHPRGKRHLEKTGREWFWASIHCMIFRR